MINYYYLNKIIFYFTYNYYNYLYYIKKKKLEI